MYSDSSDSECSVLCTNPAELTITAGTIVEWVSESDYYSIATGKYKEEENGISWSFDKRLQSHNIGPNKKFSYLFLEPGEYQYFRNEHRILQVAGTIYVMPSDGSPITKTITTLQNIMNDKNSAIPITSLSVNPKNSIITVGIDDRKDPYLILDVYKKMIYNKVGPVYLNIVTNYISDNATRQELHEKEIIPSPLQQIKLGVKLGQIICDENKTPVWNIHNKPACLTDQTYDKLLVRGWAKLRLILPASGDPIKELEWTGQNELTMRFVGTYSISDEQPLSYDKKRQLAWEYVEKYYPDQKNILQYTTFGLQPFHKQCDVINFNLLEWGNYKDCWDLGMKIRNSTGHIVYQEKINQSCLEPDSIPGTFTNYSSGIDFGGFRCHDPGLYLIEVENEKAHFPSTIIDTFVCTSEYGESKCPSGVVSFDVG
jgi:plastocyanin